MNERRPWTEPSVVSVPIPEVEEALAESYRAKAEQWANEAEARRVAIRQAVASSED